MEFPTTFDNGITVVGIRNPQWADPESIRINVDVTFVLGTEEAELPFTACPFDTFGPHCPAIFEHCAGLDVAPYERPAVTAYDLQAQLDAIWPDVVLGLADEATVDLARNLRKQIKLME